MNVEEVFSKICEIIAQQCCIETEIIEEDSTLDNIGIDSVDFVEVIMEIENEWGISVPDEEIENIETIGEVAELVCKLIAE